MVITTKQEKKRDRNEHTRIGYVPFDGVSPDTIDQFVAVCWSSEQNRNPRIFVHRHLAPFGVVKPKKNNLDQFGLIHSSWDNLYKHIGLVKSFVASVDLWKEGNDAKRCKKAQKGAKHKKHRSLLKPFCSAFALKTMVVAPSHVVRKHLSGLGLCGGAFWGWGRDKVSPSTKKKTTTKKQWGVLSCFDTSVLNLMIQLKHIKFQERYRGLQHDCCTSSGLKITFLFIKSKSVICTSN